MRRPPQPFSELTRLSRHTTTPARTSGGMDASGGAAPFIMKPDGTGWIFAPGPTKDGPFPTHHDPVESPVHNLFDPEQPGTPPTRVPGTEQPCNVPHPRRRPELVHTIWPESCQHESGAVSGR